MENNSVLRRRTDENVSAVDDSGEEVVPVGGGRKAGHFIASCLLVLIDFLVAK